MSGNAGWTILGDTGLARLLRHAARYVDTNHPLTIATEAGDAPADAIGVGPGVYASSIRHVVPFFTAFEAVEEIQRAIAEGEVGSVYGCYASMRIPRGSSPEALIAGGVGPVLAVCRDLLPDPVARVWATRASLFGENDAWFITLRLANDAIVTIEALASAGASARELLVEVTGSNQVLRAEPTTQGIRVEPLGNEAMVWPWWEDLAERCLALIDRRATAGRWLDGDDLRAVWNAVQQSAATGQAVDLHPHQAQPG
ncbi:MAG TPA: hypothetical protein PLR44_07445 [Thermomicrobiales bacterium]|nr:hypothetical protein [Thermomicrobiales bacterium]